MAKDYDIAAEMAIQLEQQSFSKTATYDANFADLKQAENINSAFVRIEPGTLSFDRNRGRSVWNTDAMLLVVIYGPQQSDDTPGVVAWLDFTDEIIDYIKNSKILDYSAVKIDNEQRLDGERLRDNNEFQTAVVVGYSIL